MKNNPNSRNHDYRVPKICDICGEYAGGSKYDHTECAKVHKELYKDQRVTKKPVKKYSKKITAKAEKYFAELARLSD